jgi:mRNA interferase MazF
VRRGEVWLAELRPRSGAEQTGRRPVVVMSNDGFNRVESWRSVIVVPMSTSVRQARRGPTAVPLERGAGGLERDSVALCHQVTTLDRGKLTRRLGVLQAICLERIEEGLRVAIDFPE